MRNEKPGGHGERSVAVGVIDMALFDLAAKVAGQPLYRFLSDSYGDGQPDDSVFVYAAGGYYAPDKGLPRAAGRDAQVPRPGLPRGQDEDRRRTAGRGPQAHRVRARRRRRRRAAPRRRRQRPVRPVRGAGVRARRSSPTTCSGTRRSATRWTTPSTRRVSEHYKGRIATGENLFSLQDARNLIRYGGMRPDRDIIQVDPALSYGLTEYLRIQDMLRQHGWSSRRCIPHGGHQFSLHIAAALKLGGNESYPGEFQPTGGFADDAVVLDSQVGLTEIPGIGFEGKAAFYKRPARRCTAH